MYTHSHIHLISKKSRYLDALIHHANIGNICTFNVLIKDFHKVDFEDRETWISILHMISGIIIGINPQCAIYDTIIELLEMYCPDKIPIIINTPFAIGESTNIKIIQIITQFVNASGNYIDGLDIKIETDDDEEAITKKRNSKIDETLSIRLKIFKALISYGADIYNVVPYNDGDSPISYNLSPIESLIINIHALLYKKNKDPSKPVDLDRALNFAYNICTYLIHCVDNDGRPYYDITEMIGHISSGIKYILYSEQFIALVINYILDKDVLEIAINVALIEYHFLIGLLIAYINGDIEHNILLQILYNENIKIEHFLYKDSSNIALQLLINAENIASSSANSNILSSNKFKIINSFIEILDKTADAGEGENAGEDTGESIQVHFYEYPLLLNWLLELEYITIIEKLLPKGLYLKDNILMDIFARSIILAPNDSKLYCYKVIKAILPYCSIRHFAGSRTIISILAPNKNKNLNYSDLYKKLCIRKKELVAPILTTARILDKKNLEENWDITDITDSADVIAVVEEKTIKKAKRPKKKTPKNSPPAIKLEVSQAAPQEVPQAVPQAATQVSTVIKAVDAMLELTKIATDEEVGKIYNSMANLCKIAADRGTTTTGIAITESTAFAEAKEEENENRKLAIHQKKIAKRREKLTSLSCILSELYRIVAGVIINNFDNNIRFVILSGNDNSQAGGDNEDISKQFCLLFETSDFAHIEPLIDGLEEIFKNVELNSMEINMETYPITDIYPSIQIKLLLCNTHSKLFDDNNIPISARSVDSNQIMQYLNMQKISEYKSLFVDSISMAATYPILSPHRAILYQIDNIVNKSLIGEDGSICQYDIVLYGSYGFGAELTTSDIDICILISMDNNNYISKLINAFSADAATNATTFANIKFIPSSFKSPNLIMMDTEQYHIDLAFSNVQPIVFNSCPDGNILPFLNNKYIELDPIEYSYLFVDQPSVCASYALLLGYHIMSTAPDLKAYIDALIQIKINSIEEKIYGSNTGYLNGGTLAIMVLYVAASGTTSDTTSDTASDTASDMASDTTSDMANDIVMKFYRIFSDWDWGTYGLVINSKHPPLKLSKLEIAQSTNNTSIKFTMLVDTYGACSSCTVWPDTLYQIQRVFRLHCLGPIYASATNTSAATTVSKLVINGNFSERGLAKKIQMITKAFRRNIDCDYAYSHYASQLLVYPEPCIEGIIICVNRPHFFTGLNYNKFLAIANGVIANESMHW